MPSVRMWFALICGIVILPHVALAQQWANEPVGMVTHTDCPMTSMTACGIVDVYGSGQLITDGSEPMSPPGVVKSTLPAGAGTGGMQLEYYLPAVSREMYVGMMWRTNPGFQGRAAPNKTFFVRGPAGGGVFVLSESTMTGNSAPYIFVHNSNLDNSHACALDLGLSCRPNVGPGIVVMGQWTKVEIYARDSTTRTSRDGIMRWWINGVPAGNYTNLNLYAGGWNQWTWTETWDNCGGNPTCDLRGNRNTVEWNHFIGHLHISTCDGCTVPGGGGTSPPPPSPTPPPPPPTGTPGTVSDLSVTALSSTSLQVQFTAVDDGTGSPAKYDVRVAPAPINWGAASSVVNGTCATTYGPGLIAQLVTCTIAGLNPGTPYQVQTVAFRGTINVNAVYGSLSNVGSASTPSIPAPIVSGFTPSSGLEGSAVIISGTGFDAVAGNNTVKINGQSATVTAASATSLTITVPSGATTGRISVQTNAGTGFSDFNFTVNVVNPPVIPDGCGCS